MVPKYGLYTTFSRNSPDHSIIYETEEKIKVLEISLISIHTYVYSRRIKFETTTRCRLTVWLWRVHDATLKTGENTSYNPAAVNFSGRHYKISVSLAVINVKRNEMPALKRPPNRISVAGAVPLVAPLKKPRLSLFFLFASFFFLCLLLSFGP